VKLMSIETTDAPSREAPAVVRRRWLVSGLRTPRTGALVLHDRDQAPSAILEDALAAHGLAPTSIRLRHGQQLPDPASLRVAFALGSGHSIDHPQQGWGDDELQWLRDADLAGTPLLATGSGAHALAVALGGGVRPAPRPQRGWISLTTLDAAVVAPGPWLSWREDELILPPRARLLAYDERGPQAFSANGHIGVQFHPVATPELVREWLPAGDDDAAGEHGLLDETSPNHAAASSGAARLFTAFIAMTRRRAP
jgi:GMP synthase (glutamine-hydrolysing)